MMQILETIPIYTSPIWPEILVLIGLGFLIVGIVTIGKTDYVGIIILIIGLVIFIIGVWCIYAFYNTEYSHDEYIVKIDNISTKEFVEHYDVTKRFKYSDVIQVREIGK